MPEQDDPMHQMMAGLDDHSEELYERSEADAQIRFYRAMADTETDYERVLQRLARAVSEVIFDLCLVYLHHDDPDKLYCAAAYHPHPETLASLRKAFAGGPDAMGTSLIKRVITGQQSYFRPRWRPSLLQVYGADTSSEPLDLAIHSLIAVPMVTSENKCIGALVVGRHTTALSFDEKDLALSEWIASHAAMKLETARLYHDLHETNRQLDAAVQERDTFISIASHELRTPLGALKIQAQTLARIAERAPERLTPEMVVPKLAAIDAQVDRMATLIDQLLNVSRIIDGGLSLRLEEMDLVSLLEEVVQRFEAELLWNEVAIHLECDDELVGRWDRERLDHILTNLVSNAIKYGAGNPISVVAKRVGRHVLLQVRDEGIGIAPEAMSMIFERFQRTSRARKVKGLGLGLWIVREYVKSLNATIDVESSPGKGSLFSVRLPLQVEAPAVRPNRREYRQER